VPVLEATLFFLQLASGENFPACCWSTLLILFWSESLILSVSDPFLVGNCLLLPTLVPGLPEEQNIMHDSWLRGRVT
jgi:hypothetical protein